MLANRSVKGAVPAAMLLAASLATWLGGCTSDVPNRVGAGLVDARLDSALIELPVLTVTDYRALPVEDASVPVQRQQVLYLGSQNGVRSYILANYDFADIYTENHPASYFTAENIKSVKLSLTKLSFYAGQRRLISDDNDTTLVGRTLFYRLQQLEAAFDSNAYYVPGDVPLHSDVVLNQDALESIPDTEPLLRLSEADFLAWLADGQTIGLMLSLGDGSDEELVGYAAREMQRYSELEDVAVGTVVAPNLVVEFEDNSILNFLLPPVADTSTFHAVAAAPADIADGFILRTCLRSYPAFDFDFSALPDDVLINRAVLKLTNDRSLAFGNSEAIVVSEIDSLKLAAVPPELTLAELDEATYVITGQASLVPTSRVRHLTFDVTTLVQRLVNDVYANPRALVLTAGEDIFPTYDLAAVDPDFYFTEFRFFGTAAADSLRPRLEITYSRHEERLGGSR